MNGDERAPLLVASQTKGVQKMDESTIYVKDGEAPPDINYVKGLYFFILDVA